MVIKRSDANAVPMLIEAIDQALSNRGELIACLDSLSNKETFSKAESKWRDYTPNPKETSTAAIDSSWNFTPYQGFYLFAVEGVSTRFDGGFLTKPLFETGLGLLKVEEGFELIHDPRLELQSRGMEYEYELAKASIGKADRVLVDGSVLARFHDRRKKRPVQFYQYAEDLMKEESLVFVAKTSSSTTTLEGPIGDIYYFNHSSKKAGYSEPYFDSIGVTVFYSRLADYTPCLRIEMPGKATRSQVEDTIDVLGARSVSGYPYELRLAHERCRIGDNDMDKLANLLGLDAEIGGREVLG